MKSESQGIFTTYNELGTSIFGYTVKSYEWESETIGYYVVFLVPYNGDTYVEGDE